MKKWNWDKRRRSLENGSHNRWTAMAMFPSNWRDAVSEMRLADAMLRCKFHKECREEGRVILKEMKDRAQESA